MPNNPVTPEALERLEKLTADALASECESKAQRWYEEYACDPKIISALLASFRTLESENRIAMRALKMIPFPTEGYLAEARAQEGKL